MTAVQFCYWLQGQFELGTPTQFDARQTELIRRHLALAFKHDIDVPDPTGELQATHDGKPPSGVGYGMTGDGTLYRC